MANKRLRIETYEQEIRDGVQNGSYKIDRNNFVYKTDEAGNMQPLSLIVKTPDGEIEKFVICNNTSVAVRNHGPSGDFQAPE